MQNKRTLTIILSSALIILSIATFIICLFLNFTQFQQGGSTTIKSVIVTFSYVAIWTFILVIGIISRNRGIVKYCSVFWIITLVTTIGLIYANMVTITGNAFDWIIPLVILFMGQWYGLRFFIWSDITRSIIIAIISLVMLVIAVIWLKHNKST
jgi:hypothetical protein